MGKCLFSLQDASTGPRNGGEKATMGEEVGGFPPILRVPVHSRIFPLQHPNPGTFYNGAAHNKRPPMPPPSKVFFAPQKYGFFTMNNVEQRWVGRFIAFECARNVVL